MVTEKGTTTAAHICMVTRVVKSGGRDGDDGGVAGSGDGDELVIR